jgi:hypothetical protein
MHHFVFSFGCPQGGKYRNSTYPASMYQFYTIGNFFGNWTDRQTDISDFRQKTCSNQNFRKFRKNWNSVGILIGRCNKDVDTSACCKLLVVELWLHVNCKQGSANQLIRICKLHFQLLDSEYAVCNRGHM